MREDAKLVGALSWAWYERWKAEEAGAHTFYASFSCAASRPVLVLCREYASGAHCGRRSVGLAPVTIAMTIKIWVLLTLFEHRNDAPRVDGTVAYYSLSTEHEKSVKYFTHAMEQSSTDLALACRHSWGSSTQGAVATVNHLTVFEEAESWEDQVHMFEAVLLDGAQPHFRFRPTFQIQQSDLVLQAHAGDGRAAPNDGVPAPGSVGRGACAVNGVLCQAAEFQVQQPTGDLVRLGRRGWGQPGIAEASEHPIATDSCDDLPALLDIRDSDSNQEEGPVELAIRATAEIESPYDGPIDIYNKWVRLRGSKSIWTRWRSKGNAKIEAFWR
ncbi:hypothetical protein DFH09DRAFT_1102296 [Mycena vulgaris]|nr:hypothetical protein DFH09DRAFT_1102296 [Mycena vulgaris]